MKKKISFEEQIAAAQKEVNDWPASIKSATTINSNSFSKTPNDVAAKSGEAKQEENDNGIAVMGT